MDALKNISEKKFVVYAFSAYFSDSLFCNDEKVLAILNNYKIYLNKFEADGYVICSNGQEFPIFKFSDGTLEPVRTKEDTMFIKLLNIPALLDYYNTKQEALNVLKYLCEKHGGQYFGDKKEK